MCDNWNTPIVEGIKAVGTGKMGSKSCTAELAEAIVKDLARGRVAAIPRAAFFGALKIKGLSESESILATAFPPGVYEDNRELAKALSPEAPDWVIEICGDLLTGANVPYATALRLGRFMFSDHPGDGARALIASIMRVRYSTPEEYAGLHKAMSESFAPVWREPSTLSEEVQKKPILQLADPFDGVDRSYLLTPLLANDLTALGYRVVVQVGRSSGPKFGVTLSDVAKSLALPFAHRVSDFDDAEMGRYVDQKDLSLAMDRWVDIRQQTIKRPFLATLEKYVDPAGLDIFVASAFHHNFSEKMVDIAEHIGFPTIIVFFKSVEGSLGLSLGRGTDLVRSDRQADGSYRRQEWTVQPEDLGFARTPDPKDIEPTVEKNAALIRNHIAHGSSGDEYFDQRVAYTRAVLRSALGRDRSS